MNNTIKTKQKKPLQCHPLTYPPHPHPKKSNMNAEATRRHIGLALGVFFEFIPISTIAPGLGLAVNHAAAGVAGKTAGEAAATGRSGVVGCGGGKLE